MGRQRHGARATQPRAAPPAKLQDTAHISTHPKNAPSSGSGANEGGTRPPSRLVPPGAAADLVPPPRRLGGTRGEEKAAVLPEPPRRTGGDEAGGAGAPQESPRLPRFGSEPRAAAAGAAADVAAIFARGAAGAAGAADGYWRGSRPSSELTFDNNSFGVLESAMRPWVSGCDTDEWSTDYAEPPMEDEGGEDEPDTAGDACDGSLWDLRPRGKRKVRIAKVAPAPPPAALAVPAPPAAPKGVFSGAAITGAPGKPFTPECVPAALSPCPLRRGSFGRNERHVREVPRQQQQQQQLAGEVRCPGGTAEGPAEEFAARAAAAPAAAVVPAGAAAAAGGGGGGGFRGRRRTVRPESLPVQPAPAACLPAFGSRIAGPPPVRGRRRLLGRRRGAGEAGPESAAAGAPPGHRPAPAEAVSAQIAAFALPAAAPTGSASGGGSLAERIRALETNTGAAAAAFGGDGVPFRREGAAGGWSAAAGGAAGGGAAAGGAGFGGSLALPAPLHAAGSEAARSLVPAPSGRGGALLCVVPVMGESLFRNRTPIRDTAARRSLVPRKLPRKLPPPAEVVGPHRGAAGGSGGAGGSSAAAVGGGHSLLWGDCTRPSRDPASLAAAAASAAASAAAASAAASGGDCSPEPAGASAMPGTHAPAGGGDWGDAAETPPPEAPRWPARFFAAPPSADGRATGAAGTAAAGGGGGVAWDPFAGASACDGTATAAAGGAAGAAAGFAAVGFAGAAAATTGGGADGGNSFPSVSPLAVSAIACASGGAIACASGGSAGGGGEDDPTFPQTVDLHGKNAGASPVAPAGGSVGSSPSAARPPPSGRFAEPSADRPPWGSAAPPATAPPATALVSTETPQRRTAKRSWEAASATPQAAAPASASASASVAPLSAARSAAAPQLLCLSLRDACAPAVHLMHDFRAFVADRLRDKSAAAVLAALPQSLRATRWLWAVAARADLKKELIASLSRHPAAVAPPFAALPPTGALAMDGPLFLALLAAAVAKFAALLEAALAEDLAAAAPGGGGGLSEPLAERRRVEGRVVAAFTRKTLGLWVERAVKGVEQRRIRQPPPAAPAGAAARAPGNTPAGPRHNGMHEASDAVAPPEVEAPAAAGGCEAEATGGTPLSAACARHAATPLGAGAAPAPEAPPAPAPVAAPAPAAASGQPASPPPFLPLSLAQSCASQSSRALAAVAASQAAERRARERQLARALYAAQTVLLATLQRSCAATARAAFLAAERPVLPNPCGGPAARASPAAENGAETCRFGSGDAGRSRGGSGRATPPPRRRLSLLSFGSGGGFSAAFAGAPGGVGEAYSAAHRTSFAKTALSRVSDAHLQALQAAAGSGRPSIIAASAPGTPGSGRSAQSRSSISGVFDVAKPAEISAPTDSYEGNPGLVSHESVQKRILPRKSEMLINMMRKSYIRQPDVCMRVQAS